MLELINIRGVLLLILLFLFSYACSSADDFGEERKKMVETQIAGRGIDSEKLLKVMREVPRHLFVPKALGSMAYSDRPLPIGEGQTISQPYVVAIMTYLLDLKGNEKTLEIGTGSGYQAAVLSKMCREVYTIEIEEKLAQSAAERLEKLGYKNVTAKYGDGYAGWEEHAPFDAIMITAAAETIPQPLIDQLKEGGKIILPLGAVTNFQTLTLGVKKNGKLELKEFDIVRFVPMTGKIQQ